MVRMEMGYDFEKLIVNIGPNVSNFALLSSNLFNIISCNMVFFVKITSYAVYIHFRVQFNAFLVQIVENICLVLHITVLDKIGASPL